MAIRDDFAAGEVLAAADLNDTFASKVDYALPTNAQTGTTYTFVAADAEKLTTASNGSAVTLTVPPASSVAWPDNTVLRVVNYGAGAVTVAGGSGVTVTNTASTLDQYQAGAAIRTGSDAWTFVPFSGGAGDADFSNSATGTYTDSGVDYKYVTFTSSGTLTVTQEGYADILVVGGGGGGMNHPSLNINAGGGSGGVLETVALLSATTYTITVGGGGATASSGGSSTIAGIQTIGGGGGGYADDFAGFNRTGHSGGGCSGGIRKDVGSTNGGAMAYASSITGTSVTYGPLNDTTANLGGGKSPGNGAGGSGVVIVRVRTN